MEELEIPPEEIASVCASPYAGSFCDSPRFWHDYYHKWILDETIEEEEDIDLETDWKTAFYERYNIPISSDPHLLWAEVRQMQIGGPYDGEYLPVATVYYNISINDTDVILVPVFREGTSYRAYPYLLQIHFSLPGSKKHPVEIPLEKEEEDEEPRVVLHNMYRLRSMTEVGFDPREEMDIPGVNYVTFA